MSNVPTHLFLAGYRRARLGPDPPGRIGSYFALTRDAAGTYHVRPSPARPASASRPGGFSQMAPVDHHFIFREKVRETTRKDTEDVEAEMEVRGARRPRGRDGWGPSLSFFHHHPTMSTGD